MNIDSPKISHAMALRALFAASFNEDEHFVDAFFSIGFSPERARVITDGEAVKAALYWFDCEVFGERLAYIFGVSTVESERGKGLCKALMNDTHAHLKSLGYSGALIVPAEESLYSFYESLGYSESAGIKEYAVAASESPAALCEISAEEYCELRERYLPRGGIIESIEMIKLLESDTKLYTGEGFLLAARKNGDELIVTELLGKVESAPDILAALGCGSGKFRTVGDTRRFSMLLSFKKSLPSPTYLGVALDI